MERLPLSYSEIFDKVFPYYLSIGMSAEQFWEGECFLVKAYREAERLRTDRKNQELWLQGLYIYEALCNVSPVLHAFAKQGTKPLPYPSEPYPITEQQLKRSQEEKEKQEWEKQKRSLEVMATIINNKFKEVRENERSND